jgi:hypothetical protein
MELLVFTVAFFLSMSILAETLGVWARVQGAFNGEAASGYSTHVRIATLGRFFILLSAPALGYLVDTGASQKQVALIGFYVFLIIFISIALFLKFGIKHFAKVYKMINRKSIINNIDENLIDMFSIDKRFLILVFISFLFTGTGVIFVNYLAVIFSDMRAMIVQMSAVITMFGTLVHVFLIDPKLSSAADKNKELLIKYVITFLYSRLISSIVLVLLFFALYMDLFF